MTVVEERANGGLAAELGMKRKPFDEVVEALESFEGPQDQSASDDLVVLSSEGTTTASSSQNNSSHQLNMVTRNTT